MAQDFNNTAERELLNLIEGKSALTKAGPPEKPAAATKVARPAGPSFDAAAFLTGLVSSITAKFRFEKKEGAQAFGLSQIKAGLFLMITILLVAYMITFMTGMSKMRSLPRFVIPPTKATAKGITLPLKDYSYYLDKLLGRNIFNPYTPKKVVEVGLAPKINDLAKDIRLTGISWSDKAIECFAIIEDTQAKITYFLKEGEMVSKSSLAVKKIYKDKVILSYQGEELELR